MSAKYQKELNEGMAVSLETARPLLSGPQQ